MGAFAWLLMPLISGAMVATAEQQWKSNFRYKPYTWGESMYPIKYSTAYKAASGFPATNNNERFSAPKSDGCDLHKIVFTQDSRSPQYVLYKSKIPDIKEFTLCHWHNIFNYTHDHPIFSYSLPGRHRVIYSWIENSPEKTYYNLAINGHTIYRMNYPEKLFKWYHVCQSWNGHTGEWQLWVNTERVGRGFYNLMVGKLIKGGGVAISGREYLDHAFAVGKMAYSGELTLMTMYKAALTAGKAYNDHKHHHAHNFHHGYDPAIDEADDNEDDEASALTPEPTLPPHLAHGGGFVNGQRDHNLPIPHLSARDPPKGQQQQQQQDQQFNLFDGGLYDFYSPLKADSSGFDETFRVNLLDRQDGRRKRNATEPSAVRMGAHDNNGSERDKRWVPSVGGYRNSRNGGFYRPPLQHRSPIPSKREPAEWEVSKVAEVCAACMADPFGEASILSWQDTKKQFYNGALFMPALPKCYSF
ncbi:uncharacterized protein LOC126839066 [Adelges cooleyi]|uniref:uncharacterized protein LOC126839066 n=1 Tax=Adelges cooleyi TaxID=133065 RepID=UPI00217FE304|nr:uncharacterized protein LOC126839066 [Adelges cooleyi]